MRAPCPRNAAGHLHGCRQAGAWVPASGGSTNGDILGLSPGNPNTQTIGTTMDHST
jgi:hypothetical protein